jgi:tetratricopeptide (TPR) repeat protein
MGRFAGAILCVLLGTSAQALPPQPKAPLNVEDTLDGLRGEDCGRHFEYAVKVAGDRRFKTGESPETQFNFLWHLANCAYELDRLAAAFKYADRAAAIDPESEWPQVLRMYYGYRHGNPEASLDALHVLSRIAPERVREADEGLVNALLREASKLDPKGGRELAAFAWLDNAKYAVPPPNFDDFMRMRRGRLLLGRGRVEEARRVLRGVASIDAIVEMRVDRRFDPLRGEPAFESQLEVRAAAAKDVERTRAAMRANPRSMEAVFRHTTVLGQVARDAEALAIVDEALARIDAEPAAFDDVEDYRNWMFQRRGTLLSSLGRTEEARAAMQTAAGLKEHGEVNVSNAINLAGHLVAEGRAAEALALVPRVGEASPYGKAWIETVRTCAGVQLKDEELVAAALDNLKAREADNPAALTRALLCTNDLDGAAASMIRRLVDEEMRAQALLDLQDTLDSGRKEDFPFGKTLQARFVALRDRKDVRAAVAKVGRIEKLPLNYIGG